MLFDLFTTAFNDNATRGQLSVNISSNSLAAWSAVFSGVTVLSNNLPDSAIQRRFQHAQNPLPAQSNIRPAIPISSSAPPAGTEQFRRSGKSLPALTRRARRSRTPTAWSARLNTKATFSPCRN